MDALDFTIWAFLLALLISASPSLADGEACPELVEGSKENGAAL